MNVRPIVRSSIDVRPNVNILTSSTMNHRPPIVNLLWYLLPWLQPISTSMTEVLQILRSNRRKSLELGNVCFQGSFDLIIVHLTNACLCWKFQLVWCVGPMRQADKRRCTSLDGIGSTISFNETFPNDCQSRWHKIRTSAFTLIMFQRQFLLKWGDHYRKRKICFVHFIPIWRSNGRRYRHPHSSDCFENASEKSNVSERFDAVSPRPNGNRGLMHNYWSNLDERVPLLPKLEPIEMEDGSVNERTLTLVPAGFVRDRPFVAVNNDLLCVRITLNEVNFQND